MEFRNQFQPEAKYLFEMAWNFDFLKIGCRADTELAVGLTAFSKMASYSAY